MRRGRRGRARGRAATPAPLRFLRYAEDHRDRAVDRPALGAETPEQVVVLGDDVERLLALGPRAATAHAERRAAAVVVGDEVVLAVGRVPACADPGDGRHLRTRRTGVLAPA